jgi:hypothetical protein
MKHTHTFDWVGDKVVCTGCHDFDCGYVARLTPTEYDNNIDAQHHLYNAWKYLNRKPWEPVAKWQADTEAQAILDAAGKELRRELELDEQSAMRLRARRK